MKAIQMGMKFHIFHVLLVEIRKLPNRHSENSKFPEACKGLSLPPLSEITLHTWGCGSVSN